MGAKVLSEILKEANIEPSKISKKPRVESFSQLSEKKRMFAELLLQGVCVTDAVFRAGFMIGKDQKDTKIRHNAYHMGYKMMQEPLIRDYLTLNAKPPITETGEIPRAQLLDRLTLIALGNIEQKGYTKKGEQVYFPPTFKDQKDACVALLNWIKYEEKNTAPTKRTEILSKRMDEIVGRIGKDYEIENDDATDLTIDG